MADYPLKIWAHTEVLDSLIGNAQKRQITDEEWTQGIPRLGGISAQQLNTLFYLLSSYAPPADICPYPYPASLQIPDEALEMDGQVITRADYPVLYAAYGARLPNMSSDNLSGFRWIVRKH